MRLKDKVLKQRALVNDRLSMINIQTIPIDGIDAHFSELQGQVLIDWELSEDDDELVFEMGNGKFYELYHFQDCCECVALNEIVGDLDDLKGQVLGLAEEVDGGVAAGKDIASGTWTFYKLRSLKGDVTLRWLGESNGYYSESVDFKRIL